jgi:hypothetical protein
MDIVDQLNARERALSKRRVGESLPDWEKRLRTDVLPELKKLGEDLIGKHGSHSPDGTPAPHEDFMPVGGKPRPAPINAPNDPNVLNPRAPIVIID